MNDLYCSFQFAGVFCCTGDLILVPLLVAFGFACTSARANQTRQPQEMARDAASEMSRRKCVYLTSYDVNSLTGEKNSQCVLAVRT